MAPGLVVLLAVGAWTLYMMVTKDTRHAGKRQRDSASRRERYDRAGRSADDAFRTSVEDRSRIPSETATAFETEIAMIHLQAIQGAVDHDIDSPAANASAHGRQSLDEDWIRERVGVHAEISGLKTDELGRLAAEATLASFDRAMRDLKVTDGALLAGARNFHEYATKRKASPAPGNQARAERLAIAYISAFGDQRQQKLLGDLSHP